MRIVLSMLLAFALAACAANNQGSLPSAQNSVFALKNTFAAAQTAAIQYVTLPRCGAPTSPPICSNPGAVVVIRQYNATAATTLDAAEKTVRDPAASTSAVNAAIVAAQNAITALQSVIPTFTPKAS